MRRRTAILLFLALVAVSATTYAVIRSSGSDERAKVSAPARAQVTAQVPDPVPHGARAATADGKQATRKRTHERHRAHKRHARSTKDRTHRSARKHSDSPAPDLGGLTGGTPAPGSARPEPVVAPAAPVATPSLPAPAVPVPLPPETTIGTVLDIIGAVTGDAPSSSAPAPDQLPADCPASAAATPSNSGHGSASSGSGSGSGKSGGDAAAATDPVVQEIIDALCAASQPAPVHGGQSGKSDDASDDRSGPGNSGGK